MTAKQDGSSAEKKVVLIKITENTPLQRLISGYLLGMDILPVKVKTSEISVTDTLEGILDVEKLPGQRIDAIITDDPTLVKIGSKESGVPCIYITQDDEEIKRHGSNPNIAAVKDGMEALKRTGIALQEQRRFYESLGRITMPSDKEIAAALLNRLYDALIRVEHGPVREKPTKECSDLGDRLTTLLQRTGREELSTVQGESEYHEGSGHMLRDTAGRVIFAKIMREIKVVPGGRRWSAFENADQRYQDALSFQGDLNFKIARAHFPLDYGTHCLALYDYAEGPTLNEVLHHVGQAIQSAEKEESKRKRKLTRRAFTTIAQGLVHHQTKSLAYWIKHVKPAKYWQSPDEVRAYYMHALGQLPEKIDPHLRTGPLTEEERRLWRSAIGEILGYVDYDRKITRYRDLSTRNVVVADPRLKESLSRDVLLQVFTQGWVTEGKRSGISSQTEVKEYLKEPKENIDKLSINIDTNVRGMIFLEDFYHLALEPLVWPVAGVYLEREVKPQFIASAAGKLGFDPGEISEIECAIVGFYRAARKISNLVDFGANAHDELKKERIKEGKYKKRLDHFSEDIHHYARMATLMLERVISGSLHEVPSEESTDVIALVRTATDVPLTGESAKVYMTSVGKMKDENARLVCSAALAEAYLKKLQSTFKMLKYTTGGNV